MLERQNAGIASDESADQLPWGPYQQSKRADIYLSYVRELLRAGLVQVELLFVSPERRNGHG